MAGGNENGPEDMGKLIDVCEWIAHELDCFVLLVHHSGKDEAKGSRGHTSLLGAINSEIEIKRQRGQAGVIILSKQRDGPDGDELAFKLESALLGHDGDGDTVASCVAIEADPADVPKAAGHKLSTGLQIALDALRKAVVLEGIPTPGAAFAYVPERATVVSEAAWRRFFYAARPGAKPDTKLKAYTRAQDELLAKNIVGAWTDLVWEVPA